MRKGSGSEQIDATIREAKNLAHNLIPVVLKDFGLIVAINHLINRANELYDTKFRFDATTQVKKSENSGIGLMSYERAGVII